MDAQAHLSQFFAYHAAAGEGGAALGPVGLESRSSGRVLSVLLVVVVVLMHMQRYFSALSDPLYGRDHTLRESVIFLLGLTAAYAYWSDVQREHHYEGLLKLVALIGLANVLLPCLWPTLPSPPPCDCDQDEVVLQVS